jgi:5-methylcytosine-specific restriction endonuclease McrA
MPSRELDFFNKYIDAIKSWGTDELEQFARQEIPDAVIGTRRKDLLRGDVYLLWANWFIDAVCDPARLAKEDTRRAHIFALVAEFVRSRFADLSEHELGQLTRSLSNEIWARVEDCRSRSSRGRVEYLDRLTLLTKAGKPARCWICGYAFPDEIVKRFLGNEEPRASGSEFIDIFKPSGLRSADKAIEIDHVNAFSHGGGDELDNLRLACGWCNRNKGNLRSIYDVSGKCSELKRPLMGLWFLPRSFWVIRTLAAVRRCEVGNCDATVENSELTVETVNPSGLPTPTNLRCVCSQHHFLGHQRMVDRSLFLGSLNGDIAGFNERF